MNSLFDWKFCCEVFSPQDWVGWFSARVLSCWGRVLGELITQSQQLYFYNFQETGAFLFQMFILENFLWELKPSEILDYEANTFLPSRWLVEAVQLQQEQWMSFDSRSEDTVQTAGAILSITRNPLILFEVRRGKRRQQEHWLPGEECVLLEHGGGDVNKHRDWGDSQDNPGKCQGWAIFTFQ